MQPIRAIPTTYAGTTYRSRLEAVWATIFDQLGWYFEYEPEPIDLGHGIRYLPDFRLPAQEAWVEVKGPLNSRLSKTNTLVKRAGEFVIIGRPVGPGGLANWHCVDTNNVAIFTCTKCHQTSFHAPITPRHRQKGVADWRCRCCNNTDALDPFTRIDSASTIAAIRDQPHGHTLINSDIVHGLYVHNQHAGSPKVA